MPRKSKKDRLAGLRRRAEEALHGQPLELASLSAEEVQELVHEMQVYQVELDLQNEELRHTQAQLEATTARYRDLYDSAPVGYLTMNRAGVVLQANQTCAEMLGLSRRQLTKRAFRRLVAPHDREAFDEFCLEAFDSAPESSEPGDDPRAPDCAVSGEMMLLRKDAGAFWGRLEARKVEDKEDGPCCRLVISDVTARKEAEQALQEANEDLEDRVSERTEQLATACDRLQREMAERRRAEEAYRVVAEQSLQGLIMLQQGRVVFANQAMARMTGYEVDELLAFSVEEMATLVHGSDAATVRDHVGALLEGDCESWQGEVLCLGKDHSRRWFEISATRTAYQGMPAVQAAYVDVTARKDAEQLLRIQRDFGLALLLSEDLSEALRRFLEAALRMRELDSGAVYLVNETQGLLELACHVGYSDEFTAAVSRFEKDTPEARFALTETPLYTHFDEAPNRDRETYQREGLRAIAFLPVQWEDRLLALVVLTSHAHDAVDPASRNAVEGMAARLGGVVARLRAEEALRRSEERLDLAIVGSNGGLWDIEIDPSKHAAALPDTAYFSPRWKSLIGFTEDEFPNSLDAWRFRLIAEDLVRFERIAQNCLQGKSDQIRFEYRIRHKDGTLRWFDRCGRVQRDANGVAIRWTGVDWDITQRKLIEESLRQSEEKFSKTFLASPDAILIVRLSDDVILDMNESFGRAMGFTHEEAIGQTWDGLGIWQNAEDRALYRVAFEKNGECNNLETPFRTKDGRSVAVLLSARIIDVSGEACALVIMRDVTERQRTLEALQNSEAHFRLIVENANAGYFRLDRDGRFQYVNEACARMYGYDTPGEMLGKEFKYAMTPDRGEDTAALMERLFEGETVPACEFMRVRKDNSLGYHTLSANPVIENGEVTGLEGFLIDTTSQHLAEEALRASEERYRLFFNTMTDAFVLCELVCDDTGAPVSARCVEVNAAFEKLTGLNADEIIGRMFQELIADIDPVWISRFGKTALTGESARYEEYFPELDKYLQILLYRPQKGQFAMIINDITERYQAEQERQRMAEQIQEARRLESLGVMAGGIAHDFNNLLLGIMGNAELLGMELTPDSGNRKHVNEILAASRRAAELTKQMLAYSGHGRFVMESVGLNELLDDIYPILRASVPEQISLKKQVDPDLPAVHIDTNQLQQLLTNLIANAVEAIGDEPGEVALRAGAMEATRELLANTYIDDDLPPGSYVFVEVADTGCGMDEGTLERVFDPFFTTKFTGRGLGLPAVLGIVRGHQGALQVRSSVAAGTVIRVLLPSIETLERERGAAAEEEAQTADGSDKVLIVDDEDVVREVATAMLERLGYQPLTASSGREAVRLFEEKGDEIGCVLLDLTMPDMDGHETFQRLREIRRNIRVVLSSGYSEQQALSRFGEMGVAAFIQKPYESERLASTLSHVFTP